jgi:hypothetical protein
LVRENDDDDAGGDDAAVEVELEREAEGDRDVLKLGHHSTLMV